MAANEALLYVLSRSVHINICEACWCVWSGRFDLVQTFHLVCLKESWIIVVVQKGRSKGSSSSQLQQAPTIKMSSSRPFSFTNFYKNFVTVMEPSEVGPFASLIFFKFAMFRV